MNRAALADEVRWVPAVENRGEGVFISFKSEEVHAWRQRSEVSKREIELAEGFKLWKKQYPSSKAQFVGAPYMMLHSLAHLLITQVSLECGYSSSAIRERVYAGDAGYGILLYTGSPDSEGTLGGLVEIGRKTDQHLRNAIELGRLCSNDPVCAQHSAKQLLEERFLLGAACHGCLLIYGPGRANRIDRGNGPARSNRGTRRSRTTDHFEWLLRDNDTLELGHCDGRSAAIGFGRCH